MWAADRLPTLRFLLAAALSLTVVVGSFVVICLPNTAADNVAAFALISTVTAAWLVIVHQDRAES